MPACVSHPCRWHLSPRPVQMAGGSRSVELGECDPFTLHPDLSWLQRRLSQQGSGPRVKMVIITNPCNPTGESAGDEAKGQDGDHHQHLRPHW